MNVEYITYALKQICEKCVFQCFTIRFLFHFLMYKVHNLAAAVQSSRSCGAWFSSSSGYNSVWVCWWPWHLQCWGYALCSAANHHGADAQRTYAPTGEWEYLLLKAVSLYFHIKMLCSHSAPVYFWSFLCTIPIVTNNKTQTHRRMWTSYVICDCEI